MTSATERQPIVLPVTVVIPVYNRREAVVTSVRSVLAQSGCQPERILVVDDASTDGSADAAAALGCEVVRMTTNGGAAVARNAGLNQATTPWVAFLDSDDVWRPNLLSTLWQHAEDYVLVSGAATLFADGRPVTQLGTESSRGEDLDSPDDLLRSWNPVVTSATLVLADVARAVGGFDATLRYSEDLDLWIRVLERGRGRCDAAPVVDYTRAASSKSQSSSGAVEQARADIVGRYRHADWWSGRTADWYLGGVYWQGVRTAARLGQRRAAAAQMLRALSTPGRARGLVAMLLRNRRLRKRAAGL